MSQYVDLILDRPRRFKLTPSDWRDAARQVSSRLGMPVSTLRLLVLVGESDEPSLACVMSIGCRHEDPKFTTDKALEVIDARRVEGKDLEDIGEAILDALRANGVLRRGPEEGDSKDPNPQVSSPSSM